MTLLHNAHESMVRRGKLVENLVLLERPELLSLFRTYQNEALEARKLLDSSLNKIDPHAEILEVGGGILALTVQLASEGFEVTTVEPVGKGFTNIGYLINMYLRIAEQENIRFNFIESPIEKSQFQNKFDFIFSINVMEHLKDPFSVVIHLMKYLNKFGKIRFFCPNYDFPYEPHFQRWLFTRRNEAFYLPISRAKSKLIDASEWANVYCSLNFLTLSKLDKFFSAANIQYEYNKNTLRDLLQRAVDDAELQNRHKMITYGLKLVVKFRMIGLINLLPKKFWPVIDIEIYG
jgi:2-polyprenyl-3-methyl-5-hydroxy-6-metoxy-1,4-benzoquinol methylase